MCSVRGKAKNKAHLRGSQRERKENSLPSSTVEPAAFTEHIGTLANGESGSIPRVEPEAFRVPTELRKDISRAVRAARSGKEVGPDEIFAYAPRTRADLTAK